MRLTAHPAQTDGSLRRGLARALVLAAMSGTPAVVPAAAGSAETGSAATAAASSPCRVAGSHRVASNPRARVLEVGEGSERRLLGCLRTDRPARLTAAFDGFERTQQYSKVRLTGRFVAWHRLRVDLTCKAQCPPSYDPNRDTISVYDLKLRRKRVFPAEATEALVLTATGAVAWVQPAAGGVCCELVAVDADGRRTLDPAGVDPASLRREGRVVRWTGDGQPRSATLR